MCRRCGESDRRGSAKIRRHRRRRLLQIHGNGVIAACTWCWTLVGDQAGYLRVDGGRRRLTIYRLEQDRLTPGGPYSLWNLVPACGPCNRARHDVPEGCEYG